MSPVAIALDHFISCLHLSQEPTDGVFVVDVLLAHLEGYLETFRPSYMVDVCFHRFKSTTDAYDELLVLDQDLLLLCANHELALLKLDDWNQCCHSSFKLSQSHVC